MPHYEPANVLIPHNLRQEINKKIIYLIDQQLCDRFKVSKSEIYNTYTGKGGLHGLSRKDYANYHDYAQDKKLVEQGQFFTPHELCKYVIDCLQPSPAELIADIGCGIGNFFNHCAYQTNLYGCDIDLQAVKVARYLYPEAHIEHNDMRYYLPKERFDLVVGNPPFNLDLEQDNEHMPSQLVFLLKAASLLKPAGIMAVIVPLSFLNDDFMDRSQIEKACKDLNYIAQFRLDDKAFSNQGAAISTKLMFWQKKSKSLEDKAYHPAAINQIPAAIVHEKIIAPLKTAKEKERSRIYFEMRKEGAHSRRFFDRIQKLLFDIKRHPRLVARYGQCVELLNRYLTQKKPDDMTIEEWERVRLRKKQVIDYLQRIVKTQHVVEKDEIRLVKTNAGLRLKAYSQKTRDQLSAKRQQTCADFSEMAATGHYPFKDKIYKRLVMCKHADYTLHDTKITDLKPDQMVLDYVNSFSLFDSETQEVIKPNQRQRDDLKLIITKGCGILNWQQGSGKTLAGIAFFKYMMAHRHVRNKFIVSTALAIGTTWTEYLTRYKIAFVRPTTITEFNSVRPGQIVLITHHVLSKLKRQIKRYLKIQSQKVVLVVDESDEFTNEKSLRTRAMLAIFRKVRNVLELTGTTTRNNAAEFFSQLELLYNNSYNMLCQCPDIYRYNRKKNELEEITNEYYKQPFPAYHGAELFKQCFNPHKATVFGIRKHNQDIFNADELVHILERTVITRTFEQIVGKKLYSVKTFKLYQNADEKILYSKILKAFVNMYYYFKKADNSRKDAMLKLIRQINLLIKAASLPHIFKEYKSDRKPEKYFGVLNLIKEYPNQKVAVGSIHKAAAEFYHNNLANDLNGRQVFLVTGEKDINRRKKIIDQFQATDNGILVCTQQSLSSSINIESCDIAIIESIPWNLPKLTQHYHRYIRYNSKRKKKIFIVSYENTIEQNLLALLMAKEKVNQFMQVCDHVDDLALFEKFGIDGTLISSLIEKDYDEDGNMRLTWGKQRVCAG